MTATRRRTKSVEARFYSKVALPASADGCWRWTGAMSNNGYGNFWDGVRLDKAHRVSYLLLVGPIPVGMDIDHLCRNRGCVRPDHLEVVTRQTNLLRGMRKSGYTSCKKGHPYNAVNTRWYAGKGYLTRICRECERLNHLARDRIRKR